MDVAAVTKRPAQPVGLLEEHRAALETSLRALAEEGRAGYGVYFRELTGGATIRLCSRISPDWRRFFTGAGTSSVRPYAEVPSSCE